MCVRVCVRVCLYACSCGGGGICVGHTIGILCFCLWISVYLCRIISRNLQVDNFTNLSVFRSFYFVLFFFLLLFSLVCFLLRIFFVTGGRSLYFMIFFEGEAILAIVYLYMYLYVFVYVYVCVWTQYWVFVYLFMHQVLLVYNHFEKLTCHWLNESFYISFCLVLFCFYLFFFCFLFFVLFFPLLFGFSEEKQSWILFVFVFFFVLFFFFIKCPLYSLYNTVIMFLQVYWCLCVFNCEPIYANML